MRGVERGDVNGPTGSSRGDEIEDGGRLTSVDPGEPPTSGVNN